MSKSAVEPRYDKQSNRHECEMHEYESYSVPDPPNLKDLGNLNKLVSVLSSLFGPRRPRTAKRDPKRSTTALQVRQ